jgi:hypothetical protein
MKGLASSMTNGTSLTDEINKARESAHRDAGVAIEELGKAAKWLDLRPTAAGLQDTKELLESVTFNLMVMGRFKNGKSTFINALLAGTSRPVPAGADGLMAMNRKPTTAVLTTVQYDERPWVRVDMMDGSQEEWSFDRYLQDSKLGSDNAENERFFAKIRQFRIGFPATLCEAGVVVIDSPGTDESPIRTQVTLEAARRVDAVIRPYRTDSIMGQSELEEDATVRGQGTKVFTIVNLWKVPEGEEEEDIEETKAVVWDRYVREHLGGPRWAGQDFAQQDIFFVNALDAFRGRAKGDDAAVEKSGLPAFERRLGEFLANERFPAHLVKHATSAIEFGKGIDEHISQREAAARTDQQKLQEAYLAEQPKITQLQARASKLPGIFAAYRAQAELDLRASFRQAIADLRRDLPGHMETVELPGGSLTAVLQAKKMTAAASEALTAYVTGRLEQWAQRDAMAVLTPIKEQLSEEIAAEVAEIGRQLEEIHFRMTGWEVGTDGQNVRLVGTTERVLSAIAGLFFGDISAAVTGGAGGWRGAAGGIAGALGAAFLLTIMGVGGVIFLPVTLAAAAVGGLLLGGMGLDKRVIKKVVETADPELAKLPDSSGDQIARHTAAFFAEAEREVTAEVSGYIDEQVRAIEQFVELNQRDQASKDRILKELAQARARVRGHLSTLQQAIAVARQG